jgi:hypothetical protein
MTCFGYSIQQLPVSLKAGTETSLDISFLQETFQIIQDQEHPCLAQAREQKAKALFEVSW